MYQSNLNFLFSFSVPWLADRLSLCAVNNDSNWMRHNSYLEVSDTDDWPTHPLFSKNLPGAVADAVHGGDEELHHEQAVAGAGE